MLVTHFKHSFPLVHKSGKVARWIGGKEHDRSAADEETYSVICAGCEVGERNGMRPLRPPYCTLQNQVIRKSMD